MSDYMPESSITMRVNDRIAVVERPPTYEALIEAAHASFNVSRNHQLLPMAVLPGISRLETRLERSTYTPLQAGAHVRFIYQFGSVAPARGVDEMNVVVGLMGRLSVREAYVPGGPDTHSDPIGFNRRRLDDYLAEVQSIIRRSGAPLDGDGIFPPRSVQEALQYLPIAILQAEARQFLTTYPCCAAFMRILRPAGLRPYRSPRWIRIRIVAKDIFYDSGRVEY